MSQRERGFTFLELLAVVSIIGMMSSLVIPKVFYSLAQQQLRAFADELMNDMRYLQQQAIADGKSYEIRFYQHTNPPRYLIYQGATQMVRKDLPQGVIYTASSFTLTNPVPTLRLNTNGTPSSGGAIEFTNKHNKKVRVIATPVTARVRIEEPK
ncbi:MAG: GspH/FimT family pseudopilin [Bacillota bacterium]|nr:GspH/FimT family pseudopilin [Bacillota bacterium]